MGGVGRGGGEGSGPGADGVGHDGRFFSDVWNVGCVWMVKESLVMSISAVFRRDLISGEVRSAFG